MKAKAGALGKAAEYVCPGCGFKTVGHKESDQKTPLPKRDHAFEDSAPETDVSSESITAAAEEKPETSEPEEEKAKTGKVLPMEKDRKGKPEKEKK